MTVGSQFFGIYIGLLVHLGNPWLPNVYINVYNVIGNKEVVFVTKKPKVLTFLFGTFVLSSSLDLLVSILDVTNNQIITNKTTKTADLINTVLPNKHKRDNGG